MRSTNATDQVASTLRSALEAAPPLRWPSSERDRLWLVVQESICTRGRAVACPMGSLTPQEVAGEDARQDELLAAMSWLFDHERDAREMDRVELFRMLRGVAVRGRHGSARRAQEDALHGMTGVVAGEPVTFVDSEVA
jgi:hypothetical protein